MSGLEHRFVAGLRFRTEVEYEEDTLQGPRWQTLPRSGGALQGGAALVVIQALALQGRMPRAVAMACSRRLKRARMGPDPDGTMLKKAIQSLDLPIRVTTAAVGDAATAAVHLQHALASGAHALLRSVSPRGLRWDHVVGIETRDDDAIPSALLLLDTDAYAPWACGHNNESNSLETATLARPAAPIGFR